MDAKETIGLILNHIYGMWRYRWAALVTAWVVSLLGWTFVYLLPDKYQASTQVYVDTESVLRPLLKGLTVQTDVMNDVTIMSRTLLSRPSLEKVARETDLDLLAKTPSDYEALLKSLEKRIEIKRAKNNIFSISFEDADRTKALSVVKKLLDNFVEDTLGSGQKDSVQAERTLKDQIASYEHRLTQSENRLKEFKRKNVGLMPGEYGDYYAQLQLAQKNLAGTEQNIRIEKQKRMVLKKQLKGEVPVLTSSADGGISGLTSVDSQIQQLQHRLSDLRIDFTDKHPEVIRVNSLLRDLKQKQAKELAELTNNPNMAATNSALSLNPVYQNIKIQLGNSEVELSRLGVELANRKAKVNKLKQQVNVIPQVEAELNRLNRDYGVVKKRYDTMLARWENLQTAKRVRTGSDEVQFRVIEPPFSALRPSGPPRTLFVLGVFTLAVAVGLSVAFLINSVKPVYTYLKQLESFHIPVIGGVSMIRSSVEIQRMRVHRIVLLSGAVALVLCNIAVMFFADRGAHLLQQLT